MEILHLNQMWNWDYKRTSFCHITQHKFWLSIWHCTTYTLYHTWIHLQNAVLSPSLEGPYNWSQNREKWWCLFHGAEEDHEKKWWQLGAVNDYVQWGLVLYTIIIPAALSLPLLRGAAVCRAPTTFQNDWFFTRISIFFQSPIFSIASIYIYIVYIYIQYIYIHIERESIQVTNSVILCIGQKLHIYIHI